MPELMLCCRLAGGYCDRCDLLVGLDGLRVTAVEGDEGDDRGGRLTVTVESSPGPMGCSRCGVVAVRHGRVEVVLVDVPWGDRPVRIRWRKRRWRCLEPACPVGSFVEQNEAIVRPRGLLTNRACRWAIGQLRREHASVLGWPGSSPRRGTPCGAASSRCCWSQPRTSPASKGWSSSASTGGPPACGGARVAPRVY